MSEREKKSERTTKDTPTGKLITREEFNAYKLATLSSMTKLHDTLKETNQRTKDVEQEIEPLAKEVGDLANSVDKLHIETKRVLGGFIKAKSSLDSSKLFRRHYVFKCTFLFISLVLFVGLTLIFMIHYLFFK